MKRQGPHFSFRCLCSAALAMLLRVVHQYKLTWQHVKRENMETKWYYPVYIVCIHPVPSKVSKGNIMGDLRLEIRRGHVVRDMTEGTFIHIKVGPLPSLSLRGGINVGVWGMEQWRESHVRSSSLSGTWWKSMWLGLRLRLGLDTKHFNIINTSNAITVRNACSFNHYHYHRGEYDTKCWDSWWSQWATRVTGKLSTGNGKIWPPEII